MRDMALVARGITASLESMVNQLQLQTDPNAAVYVIRGEANRLDVRVMKTCLHCSEDSMMEQQDISIIWRDAPGTNVRGFMIGIHKVNSCVYKWFDTGEVPVYRGALLSVGRPGYGRESV